MLHATMLHRSKLRSILYGLVAALGLMVITSSAAHAEEFSINCSNVELELAVNFSTDQAQGTSTWRNCLSLTHPEIVQGDVVINGTASGAPSNVSVSEVDQVVWKDASGSTVATSEFALSRNFIGLESAMVEIASGVVTDGLFNERPVLASVVGLATRTCENNSCVYRNQSDGIIPL